jgi:hypothetical protein
VGSDVSNGARAVIDRNRRFAEELIDPEAPITFLAQTICSQVAPAAIIPGLAAQ